MGNDRPRVLIVDDEPGVRLLVRRVLMKEFDADVVEASDGLAALERLDAESIDLVILDLGMPVINGLDTLEAIRRSPRHAGLPVVVLSGDGREAQVRRGVALDVKDFIVKPVTAENLNRLCRPLLMRPRRDAASPASGSVELSETSQLLVVDESDEFRSFVTTLFRGICYIESTDSALAALRSCLQLRPQALLLGKTSGLMDDALLDRMHRESAELAQVPILRARLAGAPARSAEPANRTTHELPRTVDPHVFLRALRGCLAPDTFARVLLGPASPVVEEFFDESTVAVAGAFGRELEATTGNSDGPPFERQLLASLQLTIASTRVLVSLVGLHGGGVQMLKHQVGAIEDRISDPQIEQAFIGLMSAVGDILADTLRRFGLQPALGLPKVVWLAAGQEAPPPPAGRAYGRSLRSVTGDFVGSVVLSVHRRL